MSKIKLQEMIKSKANDIADTLIVNGALEERMVWNLSEDATFEFEEIANNKTILCEICADEITYRLLKEQNASETIINAIKERAEAARNLFVAGMSDEHGKKLLIKGITEKAENATNEFIARGVRVVMDTEQKITR